MLAYKCSVGILALRTQLIVQSFYLLQEGKYSKGWKGSGAG